MASVSRRQRGEGRAVAPTNPPPATSTTSDISLYCFIHNTEWPQNAFPIKVDRAATVGELRNIIYAKMAGLPAFKGVQARNIRLWAVSILYSNEEEFRNFRAKGQELYPAWKISKVFSEEPHEDHIHVIVELPGPAVVEENISSHLPRTRKLDEIDQEGSIKELHPPHKPYQRDHAQQGTVFDRNNPISRFWSNLLNAKYNPTTRELTLVGNTLWFGGVGFTTSSLYVREHYEKLWSKICWEMSFSDDDVKDLYVPENSSLSYRGYIVNGIPGIGKSCFGLYILWRLRCKSDKPVMWYFGSHWFVFHPDGSVFLSSQTPTECFTSPLNWLLIDAQVPPVTLARTILLTSPERERFKEFLNLGYVRMVYMPLWDGEELMALRNCVFPQVDQSLLSQLCNFWGPVPRYVLTKAQDDSWQAQQRSLVGSLYQQDVVEVVKKLDYTYSYGLVSETVIHMAHMVIDGNYGFSGCRFASELIAAQMIGREGNQRWSNMVQFLKATAGDSGYGTARGLLFEMYAHIRLRKGGMFRARKIGKDESETVVTIPQSTKAHYFWSPSELTRETSDYCQPYSKAYEGIDSLLLPDTFFQITVAKTHGIEVEKLRGLYHITTAPRRLYFVVPEDIFGGHYNNPQPLKRSGRLAKLETTDWRTQIEQWVLMMDFPKEAPGQRVDITTVDVAAEGERKAVEVD